LGRRALFSTEVASLVPFIPWFRLSMPNPLHSLTAFRSSLSTPDLSGLSFCVDFACPIRFGSSLSARPFQSLSKKRKKYSCPRTSVHVPLDLLRAKLEMRALRTWTTGLVQVVIPGRYGTSKPSHSNVSGIARALAFSPQADERHCISPRKLLTLRFLVGESTLRNPTDGPDLDREYLKTP
jgi:hypothetical protein